MALGNYGDFPLFIRIHLGRVFSLGLGGFYSYPLGAVNYFWGAAADIQIRIPMGTKAAFVLKPMFFYDLRNTGANQLMIFSGAGGLQFGM